VLYIFVDVKPRPSSWDCVVVVRGEIRHPSPFLRRESPRDATAELRGGARRAWEMWALEDNRPITDTGALEMASICVKAGIEASRSGNTARGEIWHTSASSVPRRRQYSARRGFVA